MTRLILRGPLLAHREHVGVEHVLVVLVVAGLGLRLAILASVVLPLLPGDVALLYTLTETRLVGRITLLEAAVEGSVGDHADGVPEGAGEGVHGHDVPVEEVSWLSGLTADTTTESDTTLFQPVLFQDTLH